MPTPNGLFSPLDLRSLGLANRIVVSPMCMNMAVDGLPQPFHTRHVGALAESGAGLVIMEATGVEAIGRIGFGCLGLWNDAQETVFARLIADVRTYSTTPIGIQLGHAGRKASNAADRAGEFQVSPADGGWRTVGPVAEAFDAGWSTPVALDTDGLQRVKSAFVEAARRAARCGFDLIEIHGAHGYLLQSFLSPLTNRRTDAYGGARREDRMRFPLEVIEAVRAALPPSLPLGVRLNGEEWVEGGVTLDDSVVYAARLKAVGVDYVTLSSGGIVPQIHKPPVERGYMVHMAQRISREVAIPTMTVGGVVDGPQADAIVRSGAADLVAVGRAMLDDPRWGHHAAAALGAAVEPPKTAKRAAAGAWPFYWDVHAPSTTPISFAAGRPTTPTTV